MLEWLLILAVVGYGFNAVAAWVLLRFVGAQVTYMMWVCMLIPWGMTLYTLGTVGWVALRLWMQRSREYELYLFDADGTLRRCTVPEQPCPNAADEWELIPGVKQGLDEFDWSVKRFGIISNQAGVAYGYLALDTAYTLLIELSQAAFGKVDKIHLCPHSLEDRCSCRKPSPKMLQDIIREVGVDLDRVLYVGDMESDRLAAERAGVDFMWAEVFFGR